MTTSISLPRLSVIAIVLTLVSVALFDSAYADTGFVSKTDSVDQKKPIRTSTAKSITKKQLDAKIKQIQSIEKRARLSRDKGACARANKEINAIARSLPTNVTLTLEAEKDQTGYTVDSHDNGCYIYLYPRR